MRLVALAIVAGLLSACSSGGMSSEKSGGVLIFGASRASGLEVAKLLAARGEDVTAFVRPTSDRTALNALKVHYATGDALNPADVATAFKGHKYRAVISTLGGKGGEPAPDFEGTKNVVDAAKAAGVNRMIIVTVLGPGDSMKIVPEQQRRGLSKVIVLKEQAEKYLVESGLKYTILRPGQLTNEAANGKITLSEVPLSAKPITRADLAAKVVECLDSKKTIRKLYYPASTAN